MAGLADAFRMPPRRPAPSSGSLWADNAQRQAQQVPMPNVYPESPWMPRLPQFDMPGRVYDPGDVMQAREMLRTQPLMQMEQTGEQHLPVAPFNWTPWWSALR